MAPALAGARVGSRPTPQKQGFSEDQAGKCSYEMGGNQKGGREFLLVVVVLLTSG